MDLIKQADSNVVINLYHFIHILNDKIAKESGLWISLDLRMCDKPFFNVIFQLPLPSIFHMNIEYVDLSFILQGAIGLFGVFACLKSSKANSIFLWKSNGSVCTVSRDCSAKFNSQCVEEFRNGASMRHWREQVLLHAIVLAAKYAPIQQQSKWYSSEWPSTYLSGSETELFDGESVDTNTFQNHHLPRNWISTNQFLKSIWDISNSRWIAFQRRIAIFWRVMSFKINLLDLQLNKEVESMPPLESHQPPVSQAPITVGKFLYMWLWSLNYFTPFWLLPLFPLKTCISTCAQQGLLRNCCELEYHANTLHCVLCKWPEPEITCERCFTHWCNDLCQMNWERVHPYITSCALDECIINGFKAKVYLTDNSKSLLETLMIETDIPAMDLYKMAQPKFCFNCLQLITEEEGTVCGFCWDIYYCSVSCTKCNVCYHAEVCWGMDIKWSKVTMHIFNTLYHHKHSPAQLNFFKEPTEIATAMHCAHMVIIFFCEQKVIIKSGEVLLYSSPIAQMFKVAKERFYYKLSSPTIYNVEISIKALSTHTFTVSTLTVHFQNTFTYIYESQSDDDKLTCLQLGKWTKHKDIHCNSCCLYVSHVMILTLHQDWFSKSNGAILIRISMRSPTAPHLIPCAVVLPHYSGCHK